MAYQRNIVDFNQSDGIPPLLIQKLNNNFFNLQQSLQAPQITMVSGATFPNPRTNETLFYNTSTGELYVWIFSEMNNKWDWSKIDVGYIHIDDNPPNNSSYQRQDEMLWIDRSNNVTTPLYLWVGNSVEGYDWWHIGDLVKWEVSSIGRIDWLQFDDFCDAVKEIMANPDDYGTTQA